MKDKKLFLKVIFALAVSLLLLEAYWYFVPKNPIEQKQDAVSYLQKRLKQQNVPFTQIRILQESPLEIEIIFQSTSDGEKYAPDDPINLHLAIREAVLANDQGYHINALTEVVLNEDGKSIDWGWTNVIDIYHLIGLAPATITDALVLRLAGKRINTYGMSVVNENISSIDGFQSLHLELSSTSLETANQTISPIKDSLGPLVKDINAQGAQIVMVTLKVRDEKGEVLLNYLMDLQFETEGWWVADGINVDSWYLSRPAPIETDLPTPAPISSPTP